ncbi:MAG: PilZ domain-containing protein [Sphingomicrobium sp.]|nr:PilZ domain-containing protein [Sphingomonadales bacterium]
MNIFRSSVLSGQISSKPTASLLGKKKPKGAATDSLDSVPVSRDAARSADHRSDDRHRLTNERAWVHFCGETLSVELINLSGGGAMIAGNLAPRLWDRIDLVLGDHGTVECAVRWIRGDRIGLEFAHETQIEANAEQRDAMLLDVIRRSFPDLAPTHAAEAVSEPTEKPKATLDPDVPEIRRSEQRHPLIWSGTVLYNHESTSVRLRNLSQAGALIESPVAFPCKAELYLDLGEAGNLFATVGWVRGDQVGLRFAEPFDISNLALARPDLAPQRWLKPDYLRADHSDSSPWAEEWGRLSVDELKTSLEGFLKY